MFGHILRFISQFLIRYFQIANNVRLDIKSMIQGLIKKFHEHKQKACLVIANPYNTVCLSHLNFVLRQSATT